MQLNRSNIGGLPQLPEKVLQFGEGNFLRAFADWMIHKLNEQTDFNGSVVVVQPLPQGMAGLLNEQDGLYTAYQNGLKNGEAVSEHTLVSCISRALDVYADYQAYLETALNPELRFVLSNTPEAGIAFADEDKLADTPPQSFPAKVTVWLYRRYQHFKGAGDKGLIFLPCELIDENGSKLREIILRYADLWQLEPGFAQWVKEANVFCNTLVDRIVPGYPRERAGELCQDLGYEDKLLVESEQFHLWVIQGPEAVHQEFPADQAGLNVLFVDDITPYRTRKVHILNGAHTSMVPVAYLAGLNTVREAVEHPLTGSFIRKAVYEEIVPTLNLTQAELEQFAGDVLNRFRNPFIQHQLISIALNSTAKFVTRVLPTILEYQKRTGVLPKRLVFSLAALLVFYRGERQGEPIPLADGPGVADRFARLWAAWDGTDAGLADLTREALAWEDLWQMDLNQVEGLTELTAESLIAIVRTGMETALGGVS